jgi:hypothetical protein
MDALIKDRRISVINRVTGGLSTNAADIDNQLNTSLPSLWVDGIPYKTLHTIFNCNRPQGCQGCRGRQGCQGCRGCQSSYEVSDVVTSAPALIQSAQEKVAKLAAAADVDNDDAKYRRLMADGRLRAMNWLLNDGTTSSDPQIVYLYNCVNELTLANVFLDGRPLKSWLMEMKEQQQQQQPTGTLQQVVIKLAGNDEVAKKSMLRRTAIEARQRAREALDIAVNAGIAAGECACIQSLSQCGFGRGGCQGGNQGGHSCASSKCICFTCGQPRTLLPWQ